MGSPLLLLLLLGLLLAGWSTAGALRMQQSTNASYLFCTILSIMGMLRHNQTNRKAAAV
jgi:hypothetical protein